MNGDGAGKTEREALALFERSLDHPSNTRREWIIAETQGRPRVQARALRLLEIDTRTGMGLKTGGGLEEMGADEIPAHIGQHRILKLIGRGGMGSVYLAERAAGDFDHRVAVKVVRNLGDKTSLADRLRFERQTIAGLKHPNIAQLFDGGETSAGEPYFIMEYVEGAPLYEALGKQLPFSTRLAVFKAVCDAVQYAHQKLIIHRDLSPANILIDEQDRVKLIDFGISRSLSEEAAEAPERTMTKGYAAPERLIGAPATTLSDIYSLGVILKDLVQAEPAADDADLNAIAARASAEKPESRYQSVGALIEDIERYETQKPVNARGGGAAYAIGKFIQRRKLAVAASAVAVIGALGALVVTAVLYQQAETARREADQRFNQVRELANYMLFDLYDTLEDIPGTTQALSGIADKSRSYLDALNASARTTPSLKLETAQGYKRLGDITGNPIGANLGRREEAAAHLATAYDALKALYENDPGDIGVVRALAEAAYSRAVFEFIAHDDNKAAIDYAAEAETLYERALALGGGALSDRMAMIEAKTQRGKPMPWVGRGDEAITLLEEARAQADALNGRYGDNPDVLALNASAHTTLAEVMGQHFDIAGGDYTEALRVMDAAIALHEKLLDFSDRTDAAQRNLAIAHFKRALIHYGLEDDEATLADLVRAEDIASDFLSKDKNDQGMARILGAIHEQKAMTLAYLGRFDEAISLGNDNLKRISDRAEAEPGNAARFREMTHTAYMVGEIHLVAKEKEKACALFQSARDNWRAIETRWEVSAYDRETAIEALDVYLKDC